MSLAREPMSALTHFIAFLGVFFGLLVLLYISTYPVIKPLHIITFSIFGVSMMMVYAASTVYHTLFLSEKGIKRLKKIDHMMIFVSIASTYTPICLIALKGFWGWSLLAIIWGLAVIGILIKIFWIHAPRWFSSVIYVTAGWIALIYLLPIINALGTSGSLWLFIGGGFYTLGAVIYAIGRPDPWPGFFGFHEVFHVFIMVGSVMHFWLMYDYIAKY
ncbi:MAG: hemolysin III family protein [Candidatus Dadabacteria bacterium]|nr:hemolysin III family protein [Candidatus Dadabacteria bacterium]